MPESARDRFLDLLQTTVAQGRLVKLTLSRPKGDDPTLKNLFVRPVALKVGPRFAFVWRHDTRDLTKNFDAGDSIAQLTDLIGTGFLTAHLFTPDQTVQFEVEGNGKDRMKVIAGAQAAVVVAHDRTKVHLIPPSAGWLRDLGITNEHGKPRMEMTAKFRQIEKFAELLTHLVAETPLPTDRVWSVEDMGCGKGYLTFATATVLGERAKVRGIELRPQLVESGNALAKKEGLSRRLEFRAGTIEARAPEPVDILIALHACDMATDDAIAAGISSQAALIVVAPCCQKEIRAQLGAPEVLAPVLKHGIFQERQAEFATDALRALLLEWAGYRTKVFEFISTEHTAKNVMIAGVKAHAPGSPETAGKLRDFARFYGITHQALAKALGFSFSE